VDLRDIFAILFARFMSSCIIRNNTQRVHPVESPKGAAKLHSTGRKFVIANILLVRAADRLVRAGSLIIIKLIANC